MTILLLSDKLGISAGYRDMWSALLHSAGLYASGVKEASVWRDARMQKLVLLTRKGNRKSPGFNPDEGIQDALRSWVRQQIQLYRPQLILCSDTALLGLVEPAWDTATIDNLRGGVYNFDGIPFIVITPISAVHTQKKPKDVRAMNEGAENKDEFEEAEHDPDDFFVEPYTIPFGKRVLGADLRKATRILSRAAMGQAVDWRPLSSKIRLCYSESDVVEAREFLLRCILIAEDIETIPDEMLMTVVGFSGLTNDGEIRTYVFPLYVDKNPRMGTPLCLLESLKAIRDINASGIPICFHNGPYDIFWLVRYGMPPANYAYDSMTMFWSIYPEFDKDLAFVSSILLDDFQYWKGDRKSDNWQTHLIYNGKDCDRTLRNVIKLIAMMTEDQKVARNFLDAQIRVINGIAMSVRGMKADLTRRAAHGVTLLADATAKAERLKYIVADPDFNPNSPPQKMRLLYKLLGAKPRNAKGRFVAKIEDASTGAVAMRAMRSEHPILGIVVKGIMDALEPSKQISNVIKMRVAHWETGPRFYTNYNGVGTTTTRFSSSEAPIKVGGNAQNIRKEYRDWLSADRDSVLLDIDFSAGDDVFVTFESGDPKKIELFRSGKDSHSQNATLFFENWTYEQVVAGKAAKDPKVIHPITGIRQITKKLSHGCNYLMAALTLLMTAGREAIVAAAKEVGYDKAGLWDQERLADFCLTRESLYRAYYTRFAREGRDSWYSDLWREFQDTGGFLTPFGYFQRFLSDRGDRNVLRGLAATAGQAGTAGRINMAMEELILGIIRPEFRDAPNPSYGDRPRRISVAEHGIDLRLQTHDSLTFNVNLTHSGWREGVEHIYTALNRPVVIRNKLTNQLEEFRVGLESEVGPGWGYGMKGLKGNSLEVVELALH